MSLRIGQNGLHQHFTLQIHSVLPDKKLILRVIFSLHVFIYSKEKFEQLQALLNSEKNL